MYFIFTALNMDFERGISIAPQFAIYEYPRIRYEGNFVICFTLEWHSMDELCHSGILKVNYIGRDGRHRCDTIAANKELHEAWVSGLFADCGCPQEMHHLNAMRNLIMSCILGDEELEELAAWDRFYEVGFVPTCQSLSLI